MDAVEQAANTDLAGRPGIGRRVLVIGPSCSGKSTLGARLAAMLDVPFVELDALNWKPNWVPSEDEEFVVKLREATAGDGWVVAGSYWRISSKVTWPRAETVVWLDFPLRVVTRRIVTRSWTRWRRKELLWGTNYENFWQQFAVWKDESLIGYTWRNHKAGRQRWLAAMRDPQWAHLRWVRLHSAREVEEWVRAVGRAMSNAQ